MDFPDVRVRIDKVRVASIVIIVLLISTVSFLLFNRSVAAVKIYSETATVIGKDSDWVPRKTYVYIQSPIGAIPKKDCKASILVQRFKILTSTGSEYEIDFIVDWQTIEQNDVVLQFNWSIPELNDKSTKPQLNSWTEPPENPCWLEIWRNEAYLTDVKAYRID